MNRETFDRYWADMKWRYPSASKKQVAFQVAVDVEHLVNERWKARITQQCKPLQGTSLFVIPAEICCLNKEEL